MVIADVRRPLTRIGLVTTGGGLAIWVGSGASINVGLDAAGLLAAGAAVACFWAARQADLTRFTWRLFAVGCLVWCLGAFADAGGTETSTSGRDVGALVFALAGAVGLAQLVRRGRRPFEREETFGALLAGVATLAAGFEFLIRPIADETVAAAARGTQRVDLGLQVGTLVLVLPLAVALALGIGGLRQRILLLLMAACLAPATALALAGVRPAAAGEPADRATLGRLIGCVLLTVAALLARREPEHRSCPPRPPSARICAGRAGSPASAPWR